MRTHIEPLFYSYAVDLVLTGHVHAYERSLPVYNGCPTECGPQYFLLGDGGNYEGAYVPWLEPQPRWSAFRESTFGGATLVFHNSTHAYYNWTRQACDVHRGSPGDAGADVRDGIDLDGVSCVTIDDNGNGRDLPTDEAWIVRPARRGSPAAPCESEPPQCTYPPQAPSPAPTASPAPLPPPPPPPPPRARCDERCVALAVGWGGVMLGLCLGVAAGYMCFAPARRKKASRPPKAMGIEVTPTAEVVAGVPSAAARTAAGDFA